MANKLDEENILEINVLKVRGNALIFGNTIYQISNITSIQLTENKKSHKSPPPQWIKLFIYLGFILIFLALLIKNTSHNNLPADNNLFIIFIVLSIISFFISYLIKLSHKPIINNYTYGLLVTLSSGDHKKFISKDEDFIKQIVRSLYYVIAEKENREVITYDFSKKTVNVEQASSCNIINGAVEGDVVNSI